MSRKVLLIGLGRAGQYHAENIKKYSNLYAVYDTDLELSKKFSEEYGCKYITDLESFMKFNGGALDIVVICSPTNIHYEHICMAQKYNYDIFCEKPLAKNYSQMIEISNNNATSESELFVGMNRRYDPDINLLKQKIPSIGKIKTLKIISRDYPSANINFLKSSSGIYFDMIIHDIDIARYLLDSEPLNIVSYAKTFNPEIKNIGDYDVVNTIMEFPNDIVCHIDNSRETSYGYDQRIEILGENGLLQIDNPKSNNLVMHNEHIKRDKNEYSFQERYLKSYEEEYKHFIDVAFEKRYGHMTDFDLHEDLNKLMGIDLFKKKINKDTNKNKKNKLPFRTTINDCINNYIICSYAKKSAENKQLMQINDLL